MKHWKTYVYELAIEAFRRAVYDPIVYEIVTNLVRGTVADLLDDRDARARSKASDAGTYAPKKEFRPNRDTVFTAAIAEGAPAYNLTFAMDPIADYLPEGVLTTLRHPGEPDRIGVVARTDWAVAYRSHGTVRFLTSNQTETTEEGQRAQLARLGRRFDAQY